MKHLFFLLVSLIVLNNGYGQPHVNFILEFNDKLIDEQSAYDFVIKYSHDQMHDSIDISYTLGELQLSPNNYLKLKNLPDYTIIEFYFKIGDALDFKSFIFELEKRFFFQRYLYVRFYDRDGKCGWEYDSPIDMSRLPTNRRKILWWYRNLPCD